MPDEERMRQIAEEVIESRAEAVAERASNKAIHDTFQRLGIDIDDPLTAQRHFQTLARISKLLDRGGVTAITTLIAVFVSGGLALVWTAITKGGGQ